MIARLLVASAVVCAPVPRATVVAQGLFATDLVDVAQDVGTKVVKIYGAGGLRRLEAYQTGILISPEGHVLTVWSHVLDIDDVTVVLSDGRRTTATITGVDPLTEIAVLRCEIDGEPLPHFNFNDIGAAESGTRILAFSNLFGIATGNESVSVMQGMVMAVVPLAARRGAYESRYEGNVYVLDTTTSNPGAAGGALTDLRGRLLGMLGKESRSTLTGTWLNFALPADAIGPIALDIMTGQFVASDDDQAFAPETPLSLAALGMVLVPEVVARTPPFVDYVAPNSPAYLAGVRPDDLVTLINGRVVASCREVVQALQSLERDEEVEMSVLRDKRLVQFSLQASPLVTGDVESEK